MKTLIADDDFICQTLLEELLSPYGPCTVVGNGLEALRELEKAMAAGAPFDLVCLDIMMPEMDGQEVLKNIRRMEREKQIAKGSLVRAIMTTALSDPKNIMRAFLDGHCEAYLAKPIRKEELLEQCRKLGLIP
jgi:two-component system chemotaxis response regulator CheY